MNAPPSISAYTPSNMTPKLLERLFVQRENLLNTLVDRIARSVGSGERQHFLLIGPRGSGKTHLISLAENRLTARQELDDRLRIAWLGEDDAFTNLVHLAIGILKELSSRYPGEFSEEFLLEVRGRPAHEAGEAVLRHIVEKLGDKCLLLITENLDLTFQSMGDTGQKQWRAFLQETRKVSTLATSQQLFGSVTDRDEAFFGFFDIRHLEPLSVEDARELMIRISEIQNDPELKDYLDSPEGLYRMRALHYLAGGNHRMYVLLGEFLNRESLEELVSAFEELADSMTPYFQERIRSLPDQQRQLVQSLCNEQGARTVKEISGDTFIEERTCSKQLGLLKRKGYVHSHKRGKESYYDMSEPLMRLCLETKNQRGRPLALLARFLKAWFSTDQLNRHDPSTPPRVDAYRKMALQTPDTYRDIIAQNITSEIKNCETAGLKTKSGKLKVTLIYIEILKRKENIHNMENQRKILLNVSDLLEQGEFSKAIPLLEELCSYAENSAKTKTLAYMGLAAIFQEIENNKRAISEYSKVIHLKNAPKNQVLKALEERSLLLIREGLIDESINDLTELIKSENTNQETKTSALLIRGAAFSNLNKLEDAKCDFNAIAYNIGTPKKVQTAALFGLSEIMISLSTFQEAKNMLTKAFSEGVRESSSYGGWPEDAIAAVINIDPSKWELYFEMITNLYVKYDCTNKLSSAILDVIPKLSNSNLNIAQLDAWIAAWKGAASNIDGLELPVNGLGAAIEVLKSDPPSDRPLFKLPVEIRNLVRPLLSNSLGPVDE